MLGSNINSPLFMDDPVPTRRNRTHGSHNEPAFLIKGDKTSDSGITISSGNSPAVASGAPASKTPNSGINSGSYEHVGGDDDVFIINGQGGSFQLHRKTLKETLTDLKAHAHVSVRQLSAEHTESFRSVVEALRLLYGSQALYDLVIVDIREVFSDVKDVKPGTVAAFFIGCFNDDKFPGPMGCSPKCAASLPPTEGTPGYSNCDDLVLIYAEGLFSSLNEKRSTHAYIYIGDANFPGFSIENIRQLKDAGIENATLIFGNQDGSYREVTGALNLDQIPRKLESDIPKSGTNASTTTNTTNTNSGAGIALAIIIIIIIILLLVVIYRANY